MVNNQKPMTAEVRKLVHHIVDTMFDYNSTPTRQEFTGNKPTFYVELSGHTGSIDVFCNPNGYGDVWEKKQCGESLVRLCENEYTTEDKIKDNLCRVLFEMECIYHEWYAKQEAEPNV